MGEQAVLDVNRLRGLLAGLALAKSVIYRPQTESTNDDALAAAREGSPEGVLFITDYQSAGRGTRGKKWQAPPNSALLLTVLLRPPSETKPFALTQAAALALCEGLRSATGLAVGIKWPNDALVRDRKIGGILVETIGAGASWASVAGFGANLNFAAGAIENPDVPATTVLNEAGRPCDREAVIAAVVRAFDRRYRQLQLGESLATDWDALSVVKGREVAVITTRGDFRGKVAGFGPEGELILMEAGGRERRFRAGSVRLWGEADIPT